ncbi:penicillin-binding protein 1A [Delftia sp. PS-11]|uniref:penicillin-binding protein 1A n=1 Tax=Delftia sp. PS-11 TaxID=2767222 RepID=UPI002457F1AD|nr:transglycosylase domain-containing protein [Delftia sp. PS-11]KAJ8744771.1 transglycosylase domain-containing protein [Delftia sp. PS-11]
MRFSFHDLKLSLFALWQRLRASALGQRVAALPWWRRRPTRREWLLLAAALPLLCVLYVLLLIPFTPGIRDIRKAKLEQPAQVMSADGKQIALFKRSNRQWVGLDEIAPPVVKALIATEDHRFYEHHGMDWWRTFGSVVHTLRGDPQGGSTITQQLARNLYPAEIGRAPTLNRKLKEAITAFKIEALYTKDEILETYLNTVPFLYNAFGIEMAARTYFDKPAARLTVLESATLVGMLKGTSYYNPVLNPDRALHRRNTVLSQMVKRGVLDEDEFVQLGKRPMRINFERQEEPQGMAPHFAQQLRKWLIDWADRNDYNIYTDGLVVHTTIDSRLQTWALQAVARQTRTLQGVANGTWSQRDGWNAANPLVRQLVRESAAWRAARKRAGSGEDEEATLKALLADKAFMKQLREDKTRVQAGFVALDPRTSEVLAWVGSRDFTQDAYDHVQQARRQPGSTFKPFVYGAALQQGASPDDTRVDAPVEIRLAGGEVWRPTDATPPTGREMTLRDALAYSKNTITAGLMQSVGPARVARLARALGVRQSPLEEVPALALGSSPVSLLEMANAYASLAHGGRWLPPMMVTRIEDAEGTLLAEFSPPKAERALDEEHAYALVDMMRAVVDKGTGAAIRQRYGIHADVAGKTGTTQGNADGWFILMHPEIVAGAWAGFNDARITLRSDQWGQGSRSALPMVGDFMARALRSPIIDAKARFVAPEQSHWWSDFVGRLRQRIQGWWPGSGASSEAGGLARPHAPEPDSAPEPSLPTGPGLSPGEEIIESTPALPAPSVPLTQGSLRASPDLPVVPSPPVLQEAEPAGLPPPAGNAPAGEGVVVTPLSP